MRKWLAFFCVPLLVACATVVVQTGSKDGRVTVDQDAPNRSVEIGTKNEEKKKPGD
jgi:uncharacterized protein YceK